MVAATDRVRRMLPPSIRRQVGVLRRRYALSRAVSRLRRGAATPAIFEALAFGWGNRGWTPPASYLSAVVSRLEACPGPVLECGSGLTTLLLGVLAERRGFRVWTLEHDAQWADRIVRALRRHSLRNVTVVRAPLVDREAYAWYDVRNVALPPHFDTVICDGPPGSTRGGRFGLVPELHDRLPVGCVCFLDDAGRSGEQAIVHEWCATWGWSAVPQGSESSFAVLRRTSGGSAPRHQ